MPAIIRLLRRDSEFPTRHTFMNLYRNERGSATPGLMTHIMQIKVQRFVKTSIRLWSDREFFDVGHVKYRFSDIYFTFCSCFFFFGYRGTLFSLFFIEGCLLPVEKIKLRSRTSPTHCVFAFLFIPLTLGIAVLRR